MLALALATIGAYALLSPQAASRHYGVAAKNDGALAFTRATGVRDIALGAVLAAVAVLGSPQLLMVFVSTGIAVSLGDFAIARRYRGPGATLAPFVHLGGVAAFALIFVLTLAGHL